MGIQDRAYYQEDRGLWLSGRSMVVNLVLVTVAVYLADWVSDWQLSNWLRLNSDLPSHPWQFWQLLTYGFLHDQNNVGHILFNMFALWMFGTPVEEMYGRTEFLRFYLTAIVIAGLAWVGMDAWRDAGPAGMVGASGGVMAVVILFILNFPKQLIYIWGVLPVPAWLLGVIFVAFDLLGALDSQGMVANVAHLGGAAFALVYFRRRWNLGQLMPRRFSLSMFRVRPRLRIHRPQPDDLNEQVDRILQKISSQGEASLSKKERRTLEEASRRYQQRRQ